MSNKHERKLIEQEFKETKRELRHLFGKRKKEFRFDKIQNQLRQKSIFDRKNIVKNAGTHKHFMTPSIPKSIRFSITLATNIDDSVLTQCLYDVAPRFPFLFLSVKTGFFSYRLEETPLVPALHVDKLIPAMAIPFQDGGHLFRVSYYMTRINLDVNLQLVDHNLARDFLLVLTNRYFQRMNLPQFDFPLHYRDFYTYDEISQPYKLVPSDATYLRSLAVSTPSQLADTTPPRKLIKLRAEFIPSLDILELDSSITELAATNNCSLRAYVAGLLVKSICDGTERKARSKQAPVKVAVVHDLRAEFNTNSYRSFVTSISHTTSTSDALTAARILDERIAADSESNAIRAHIANHSILRHLVPTIIRKRCPREKFSAVVYDMGDVNITSELIRRTEFVVGADYGCPISCGIVRYNDKVILTLNSSLASPNILKEFTDNLVASGIKIHLTTNRRNNLV